MHRLRALALVFSAALLAPASGHARALWAPNGAPVTTAVSDQLMTYGVYGADSDGNGGVYVVWTDTRTTTPNAYLQHLGSNGNPVAGWPANGLQLTTTQTGLCANQSVTGDPRQFCPAMLADGAGGAIAVWQDWRSGTPQVYAQRVNAAGAIQWTANGVLAATSPNNSDEGGAPFIADDGSLFILYFDSAPLAQGGLNWRAQKLNLATGAQLLGAQGVVISSIGVQAFGGYGAPATDGANGFYFAWSDKRAGPLDTNTFAMRVDGTGHKVWEITVASGTGDQTFPTATSDGTNGYYVVWVDSRAGAGEIDIYGTRILQNGTAAPGWSIGNLGGNPICVSTGMQFLPFVDHYGTDLIVAWWDLHDGGSNQKFRGQRMSAAGAPAWTLNGTTLLYPTGGFSNSLIAPVLRVVGGNILIGGGWLNVATVVPSVTGADSVVGQAVNPVDGSVLFGSTGTYLGDEVLNLNPGNSGLPRAYQIVASTIDNTAIVVWLAGSYGTEDIFAQKLSTAGASAGGGGGGGTPGNTPLSPYLAVVTSDTIIAQWTDVPGASFIAALSTDSFATVVASVTVSTFRSTFTALTAGVSYKFKVKLSTEPDAAYSATAARKSAAAGNTVPAFALKWGAAGAGNGNFNAPNGVHADAYGNVYVADEANNLAQKFDNSGAFLAQWGGTGSASAQFNHLKSVAVDTVRGAVFAADNTNYRVQKFFLNGTFVKAWGSIGSGDLQWVCLQGLAVDEAGNVYTTDQCNHRVQKFDAEGNFLAKWGSQGTGDGQFNAPWGIAVSSWAVFVVDGSNGGQARVQAFDKSGTFLYKWGAQGSAAGLLSSPRGAAVDTAGNVYVADFFNNRVQRFSPDGALTGIWGSGGSGNGQFTSISGVATDLAGNVLTVEAGNNRVQRFGAAANVTAAAPVGSTFTFVSTGSISASWTVIAGNSYVIALSTLSSFSSTISSGTGALNQGASTFYNLTGGAFYFRVKISTHSDLSWSIPITTQSATPAGYTTTQPVTAGAGTAFNLSPAAGPIAVTVPAGAFGGANNVTAGIPVTIPAATSNGGNAVTPIGNAISLDLATTVAAFSKPVDIAITIPPPADPTNIYLAWYDDVLRTWWPIWTSYYSALLQQVIGQTWHFTTFAAVRVAAAADLSALKVYPNPVNFSGAARGTVKFIGLTANPTIRIYTTAGELVRTIGPGTRAGAVINDGTSGLAEWDGRNENGALVARGTYLYVVKDQAGAMKSGLIGVQR